MGKSAAAAAGGAALGGIMGGFNSGGSSASSTSAPWAAQQPYITGAYNTAQNVYNQESSVPLPSQYVASTNQAQYDAARDLAGFSSPTGSDTSVYSPIYDQSQALIGQGTTYGNNASSLASSGIGSQSPYTSMLGQYATTGQLAGNTGLSNALTGAATNGLGSLSSGASIANQVAQSGLNYQNGLNAANSGAQQAISSSTLQNAIDGANSSINRDLTENSLPQIRAAAAANGNANSSREGALEATATTNAAQQMSANADALTANAYNTGYSGGLSSYENGLSSALSGANSLNANGSTASGLGLGLTNSQLGALSSAGSQALGYQTANTNAQLAGNAQLGNAYNSGVNSAQAYSTGQLASANQYLNAGNAIQSQDQSAINNNLDSYQYQTTMPSQILNNYWNIVSKPMGTQSSSTTTQNNGGVGGAVSGLLGGASTGLGLLQNYNKTQDSLSGLGLPMISSTGLGAAQYGSIY